MEAGRWPEGHCALGSIPEEGLPQALRAPAATRLPWTVHVSSADISATRAAFAGRRRLLLAGLSVMFLVVLGGGYLIARAVAREISVARLQSNFVTAVSHEFRSPLTLA